ncbi:hypothetical protein [Mycobacterium sp. SP-6446]|uniref:hypothetical protein n=1 Tax=Mycobacterium sp. SP-6446 TaxID=1834162 RepID=UPI00096CCD57|nr:hypothetical protein [Mycobacterium sp. SP-6446]OMC16280.1 hypothetical protein A5736_00965 [Mycobacterium sp. SP-6446]
MAPLTPADVKRWDLNAIHSVFQTATGRANTLQRLGDSLQQAHNVLAEWQGEAGDAFRADVGKIRRDIEADGAESQRVAAAVSHAEADVGACKRELDDVERAAQANGWSITPDWRIDVGSKGIGTNRIDLAQELQILQSELNACKVHAHNADHELATAVGASVGDVPLDAAGVQPGGAAPPQGPPKPAPEGKPKTWQDMVLPGGAGDSEPGGTPPKGPPSPAAAGGKPPSLEDLLLPTGKNDPPGAGGQQPPPGSPLDLLRRLQQPVVPGALPPPPKPAELENVKGIIRGMLRHDGVPPDQIEPRLNDYLQQAQQWIATGGPHYVPPEPPPAPPPGFGEGFGDRWFATEQGIKNLLGQGGPGAPGVLESWTQMLKGTVETAQNPIGAVAGEVKNALDSPSAAYYLGGKASDAATTLPGLLFGGEGAAVKAGLGDIGPGVLDTGPAVSPHAPIGLDHPFGYNPWADGAAADLNSAFAHGGPTADLSRQLADMSTHYVGNNPDRVVLGAFDGQEGGYIGDARGHGGIYFDTGGSTWDAITHGLSPVEAKDLAWQVNEQFLRGQMESHVGRIEYILDRNEYSSLEDMAEDRATSFSAREINFLNENAAAYGYERVGDSWVYVGGR